MTITTTFASWFNVTSWDLTVEDSVVAAFGSESPDGFDVEAIVSEYRDAINEALPEGVALVGDEFYGIYGQDDFGDAPLTGDGALDLAEIVAGVDLWGIIERHDHTAS